MNKGMGDLFYMAASETTLLLSERLFTRLPLMQEYWIVGYVC
jgi:hypothetical protein